MSSRQKGKHRARHHAHAVKPTSMPSDWKLPPLEEPKFDPVIVTIVPPVAAPVAGLTLATTGAPPPPPPESPPPPPPPQPARRAIGRTARAPKAHARRVKGWMEIIMASNSS